MEEKNKERELAMLEGKFVEFKQTTQLWQQNIRQEMDNSKLEINSLKKEKRELTENLRRTRTTLDLQAREVKELKKTLANAKGTLEVLVKKVVKLDSLGGLIENYPPQAPHLDDRDIEDLVKELMKCRDEHCESIDRSVAENNRTIGLVQGRMHDHRDSCNRRRHQLDSVDNRLRKIEAMEKRKKEKDQIGKKKLNKA